jgi:hypothetical protein
MEETKKTYLANYRVFFACISTCCAMLGLSLGCFKFALITFGAAIISSASLAFISLLLIIYGTNRFRYFNNILIPGTRIESFMVT